MGSSPIPHYNFIISSHLRSIYINQKDHVTPMKKVIWSVAVVLIIITEIAYLTGLIDTEVK